MVQFEFSLVAWLVQDFLYVWRLRAFRENFDGDSNARTEDILTEK